MPEALQQTSAQIVFVSNLMTKFGQTDGFTVNDHVREIERYIGRNVDIVLVNDTDFDKSLLKRYELQNEYPVQCDLKDDVLLLTDLVATEEVISAKGDVLKRSFIRHDGRKLAKVIRSIIE